MSKMIHLPYSKRLVDTINEIYAFWLDTLPPVLSLTVTGIVPELGWSEPELIPVHQRNPPSDGIYELDFVALPPQGHVPEMMTAILVHYDWQEPPVDLRGVRVKGASRDLEKGI